MAELILNENEKSAGAYLHWDDATLGKAVKKLAKDIHDHKGDDALTRIACATMLVCMAAEPYSGTTSLNLIGVTDNGNPIGDWRVNVKQLALADETIDAIEGTFISGEGLKSVWAQQYDNRAYFGVLQSGHDGKYVPYCGTVLGEPVDKMSEARIFSYRMLINQTTASLEEAISKLPKAATRK